MMNCEIKDCSDSIVLFLAIKMICFSVVEKPEPGKKLRKSLNLLLKVDKV